MGMKITHVECYNHNFNLDMKSMIENPQRSFDSTINDIKITII